MNTFFAKLAMLVMFILAVVTGWSAFYMVFNLPLWNILLGVLAVFFLFRALELVDRINKYGPYSEEATQQPNPNPGPRDGEGKQTSTHEEEES